MEAADAFAYSKWEWDAIRVNEPNFPKDWGLTGSFEVKQDYMGDNPLLTIKTILQFSVFPVKEHTYSTIMMF